MSRLAHTGGSYERIRPIRLSSGRLLAIPSGHETHLDRLYALSLSLLLRWALTGSQAYSALSERDCRSMGDVILGAGNEVAW